MLISHNSDIGISFYNDTIKEVMDAAIMAEPFTFVPIKAGHSELVGGNAVVFGKITEGYDVIPIDIRTELSYEDLASIIPTLVLKAEPIQTGEVIQVIY